MDRPDRPPGPGDGRQPGNTGRLPGHRWDGPRDGTGGAASARHRPGRQRPGPLRNPAAVGGRGRSGRWGRCSAGPPGPAVHVRRPSPRTAGVTMPPTTACDLLAELVVLCPAVEGDDLTFAADLDAVLRVLHTGGRAVLVRVRRGHRPRGRAEPGRPGPGR